MLTVSELVDRLGGTVVCGDPTCLVEGVSDLEQARSFDLVFADSTAASESAIKCNAGVVVRPRSANIPALVDKCVIEADQPRLWFAEAARLLKPVAHERGIDPAASVSPDASLGIGVFVDAEAVIKQGVHIGAHTCIEAGAVIGRGVRIGENCHIYPRVVIYSGTHLGDRVVVHAGAVLGADGFGYVRDAKTGAYTQFPQQGTLFIEDDVEIGANTTIDRGALKQTRIGRGAKIDNLVHVGHNCDIGEDVILVALTGISGSSSVGDKAVIAGQVGIGDHVQIGPGVILGGQAGVFSGSRVTNDGLKPGTVLYGTPARPLRQVLREQATLARLAREGKSSAGKDNKK